MLRNISIQSRLFIAPIIILLLFLISSGIFLFQQKTQVETNHFINDVVFAKQMELQKIESGLLNVNLNMYQLITWGTAGMDTETLEALQKEINAGMERLQVSVGRFSASYSLSNEEKKYFSLVEENFPHFKEGVNLVVTDAISDPSMAIMFMEAPKAAFEEISKPLIQLLMIEEESKERLLEEAALSSNQAFNISLSLTVFAIFAALIVTVIVGKTISNPLFALKEATQFISQGKLETSIAGVKRSDEFGDMSRALELFKNKLQETRRLEKEQAEKQELEIQRSKNIALAIEGFKKNVAIVIQDVSKSTRTIQAAVEKMTSASKETRHKASAVGKRAANASETVQKMSEEAGQLVISISNINENVSRSSTVSSHAVTRMGKADEQIKLLSQSSARIEEVLTLINEIADQTNLLALNATIEAARAGEAGRGFAVVASEVKNLASQTANATQEIAQQIKGMQAATSGTIDEVSNIQNIIMEIDEISAVIAKSVSDQDASTGKIVQDIGEASDSSDSVNQDMQEVELVVVQNEKLTEDVTQTIDDLSRSSKHLASEVEGFLNKMARI